MHPQERNPSSARSQRERKEKEEKNETQTGEIQPNKPMGPKRGRAAGIDFTISCFKRSCKKDVYLCARSPCGDRPVVQHGTCGGYGGSHVHPFLNRETDATRTHVKQSSSVLNSRDVTASHESSCMPWKRTGCDSKLKSYVCRRS